LRHRIEEFPARTPVTVLIGDGNRRDQSS
jgi:hypothetical protein